MKGTVHFCMEVAGLTLAVTCLFPTTKGYCASYLTEEREYVQERLNITMEDIQREKARLFAKKNPGQPMEATSPQALETLVLCRMIAERLPSYDRILFHGSTLAIDGNGVLFTAKSGTGKSTHTRLWRETFGERVKMVNDDKPFLHISRDGVTAYGTPWQGKHGLGENMSAPLKAIVFVNRGEENRIEPMSPRELFPLLLQQTYAPDNPAAMGKTLALVEGLSRGTRLYKLYCNMDPEAAQVAFSGIEF